MKLSIITPCYNSGKFLLEMLESVRKFHGNIPYEIIIVDDGSTDIETLEILDTIKDNTDIKLIRQKNQGANAARNKGCQSAAGKYLLFLDSDNRILENFISKGIEKLETDENTDIVYGKPVFFGDIGKRTFSTGPFDINRLLVESYIDMCSIVRKTVWEKVGGLDESKNLARLQDWEFYLNIYKHKGGFYYFNEFFYEYRISSGSITATVSNDKTEIAKRYIFNKHLELFESCLRRLYYHEKILKDSKDYKLGKLLLSPFRLFRK